MTVRYGLDDVVGRPSPRSNFTSPVSCSVDISIMSSVPSIQGGTRSWQKFHSIGLAG